MSWLENLKQVKKDKNVSSKWIAEHSSIPQKTVERIFAGDTDSPKFDTIRLVCAALGVSIDDIASDTMTVLGNKTHLALQVENETLTAENVALKDKLEEITTENVLLREQLCHRTSEIKHLQDKLDLKDEIIAVHNHYINKEGKSKKTD